VHKQHTACNLTADAGWSHGSEDIGKDGAMNTRVESFQRSASTPVKRKGLYSTDKITVILTCSARSPLANPFNL
jgi:hypothetical protein